MLAGNLTLKLEETLFSKTVCTLFHQQPHSYPCSKQLYLGYKYNVEIHHKWGGNAEIEIKMIISEDI